MTSDATPAPEAAIPPAGDAAIPPAGDAAIPPAGPGPIDPGTRPEDYVLTIRCPDRPGIVAAVSAMLSHNGANIEESQQFEDRRTDRFFMRVRFREGRRDAQTSSLAQWHERMAPIAAQFDMEWELWSATAPYRTVIMVSKFGHCLNDLLYRRRAGRINMDIPAIVSNHPDLRPLAEMYGIPFHHIPVTPDTKTHAEATLRDLVADLDVHLVVLARYMQVLSDDMCRDFSGRIINIHHSFLPSFKGAKPYHQAFDRGVKLVGATAHYVTADLDEGPIIEQDVVRVDHRMTADDLVRAGEECETRVLSRAVQWHCGTRVILDSDRTVVFS